MKKVHKILVKRKIKATNTTIIRPEVLYAKKYLSLNKKKFTGEFGN